MDFSVSKSLENLGCFLREQFLRSFFITDWSPLLTHCFFSPAGSTVRTEGTWALGDQYFGSSPDVSRWPAHWGSRRATQEPAAKDWYVYTLHKQPSIYLYHMSGKEIEEYCHFALQCSSAFFTLCSKLMMLASVYSLEEDFASHLLGGEPHLWVPRTKVSHSLLHI